MKRQPIGIARHGRAMTLDQVSQELGITKERVRQIEKSALQKLSARLHDMGINREYILPESFDEVKA